MMADRYDQLYLQVLLCNILQVPSRHLRQHPVWLALEQGEITRYRQDFVCMMEEAIHALIWQDPRDGRHYNLLVGDQEHLIALIAYIHHVSREAKKLVTITNIDCDEFIKW